MKIQKLDKMARSSKPENDSVLSEVQILDLGIARTLDNSGFNRADVIM